MRYVAGRHHGVTRSRVRGSVVFAVESRHYVLYSVGTDRRNGCGGCENGRTVLRGGEGVGVAESREMMRAGCVTEVHRDSGEWVFVDVGFSCDKASCGLLLGEGEPRAITFGQLAHDVAEVTSRPGRPLNLLIEAPLSVAFTVDGNPTGRKVERRGSETRYWYVGLGCGVLVPAMYLLRRVVAGKPVREVRLFEGFASFKTKGAVSSHTQDVVRLREVVWQPEDHPGAIVGPHELLLDPDDVLLCAFKVAGMDFGIPPVVMVNA